MSTFSDNTLAAWELHAEELSKLPGVIYVSTGYRVRGGEKTDEETVVVTVLKKVRLSQLRPSTMVPRELALPNGDFVGTDVVEDPAGYPTINPDSAVYRPVPGGCEIGPFGSAFLGTLGGWFCRRERNTDSGWTAVWLTNGHVADPVTFSVIPADPRVTQPWSGGVIGNTTAISGWPNPFPGPGVTVGGVTDAAVGEFDDHVSADLQVLDIGPAPFEIGTASRDMGVQKRGRTTLLTNGTVNSFTTVNMTSPAGGTVTFGLPGQPPVFRIFSPAPGLAAAFGAPGDSGSLVFADTPGELESTFPCVGLYFAGTYSWVADQVNPNLYTVTGLAFDITTVMNQLNLETVCSCIVRSLLAAIQAVDTEQAGADSTPRRVRRSEKMMRSFRDNVLARSSVGKEIAYAVAQSAPLGTRALAEDPVAFGLAVELLEPWVKAATSWQILVKPVDENTVRLSVELGERMMERYPELAEKIKPMLELVRENEGEPVRRLIGSMRLPNNE